MKKFCMLSVGFLLAALPLCAQADDTFLQDDIAQIKEDLKVLQRQIYRDKNDTTVPQASVSNFQIRLGEYDQLIRDMNGKVENIEFQVKTLEKELKTLSQDIDLRFEQMDKKMALQPQAAKENSPKAQTKPVAAKKASGGETTTSGNKLSSKELYESALADLKGSKLKDAEAKLIQYLDNYPKENLAGNAQYWLGEVYYKQQNFAKAAIAFKNGYSNYPNGAKGPDCLLKLGLSMKALGKNQEACTAFVNLPTVFSKVSPEIAERAQKEAKALECKK